MGERARKLKAYITKDRVLAVVAMAVLCILCWLQLDASCQWENPWYDFLLMMPVEFGFLSVITMAALLFILYAIIGNLKTSGLVLAIFSTVIAIINYYVIEFHNSPLSFLELRNLGTAMNVMGSYEITITPTVLLLLLFCVLEMVVVFVPLRKMQKKLVFGNRSWKRSVALLLCSALIIFVGYLGPAPIKPNRVIVWKWTDSYPMYGFIPCTAETLGTSLNLVEKPAGYSKEALASIEMPGQTPATAQPDVILILNETLSDPAMIRDFTTDFKYNSGIATLENTIQGYAVVPQIGGGTNKSEYEYLTSNSMSLLMQSGAPFLSQDLDGITSVVSMMEEQGYETTGMHSREGVNYSRDLAYPAIGFDNVHFEEDFERLTYFRRRYCESDESVYRNLERWYVEMRNANKAAGNDKPQFIYCLTMQNHGAYEQSPDYMDTVHAEGDFGEHASEMNEYLSVLRDSDRAFVDLTKYFAEVDRPVIICMVGDHTSSFANDLIDKTAFSEEEVELRLRTTPFVIWANYDLADAKDYSDGTTEKQYMSMNFLTPYVLSIAGVAQSPYYTYARNLMEDYPVTTAYGCYYDKDGNCLYYDDGIPDELRDYFYLEYANIKNEGPEEWYNLK